MAITPSCLKPGASERGPNATVLFNVVGLYTCYLNYKFCGAQVHILGDYFNFMQYGVHQRATFGSIKGTLVIVHYRLAMF